MGFPSKIQDASLIDLLLEKQEVYPYAEERRLFYVALTRAKKKVYLLTLDGYESVFARELISKYSDLLEIYYCPLCGGKLVRRNGRYGSFWGCSNYGKTGCGYMMKDVPEGGTLGSIDQQRNNSKGFPQKRRIGF